MSLVSALLESHRWSVVIVLLACLALLLYRYAKKLNDSQSGMMHSHLGPSSNLILDRYNGRIIYANRRAYELLPIEFVRNRYQFSSVDMEQELVQLLEMDLDRLEDGIRWDLDLDSGCLHLRVYAHLDLYQGKWAWFASVYPDSVGSHIVTQLETDLQQLTHAFDSLPDYIHYKDLDGRLLGANRAWTHHYGLSPRGISGKLMTDVLTREELLMQEMLDKSIHRQPLDPHQQWITDSDGISKLLEMHRYPLLGDQEGPQGIIGISTDVTKWHNLNRKLEQENQQRIATERLLEKQSQLVRTVLSASSDPIGFFNEKGDFTGGNQLFYQMFGLSQDDLAGRRLQECGELGQRHWQQNSAVLATGIDQCYEERVVFGREEVWYEIRKSSYLDEVSGEPGIILIARDITARKQTQERLDEAILQLQKLSFVDALTQIANRRGFDERMTSLWEAHQRGSRELALLLIDVDCFKQYNDNYGHQRGDEVLRSVASTISTQLKRSVDFVARYGGEEFAVILPDTGGSGAKRIAKLLIESITGCGIEHRYSVASDRVSISIGVTSMIPERSNSMEKFINLADQALYKAKQTGRCKYCLAEHHRSVDIAE